MLFLFLRQQILIFKELITSNAIINVGNGHYEIIKQNILKMTYNIQ